MKLSAKKKRIISNILFVFALIVIYSIAAFGVVTKITGGTVYLFNVRYDVVLSQSMSYRNEYHKDTLEGTTQFERNDLLRSRKVEADTPININDVILFNNPSNKNALTSHRVINIYEEGNEFTVKKAAISHYHDHEVIYFPDVVVGEIELAILDVSDVTVTAYTPSLYSNYLLISFGQDLNEFTAESEDLGSYYRHTLTFHRSTTAPQRSVISLATDEPLYIEQVQYNCGTGKEIIFNGNEYAPDDNNDYHKLYYSYFLYETRGDANKTADPTLLLKSNILAKVENVIPKLGHVIKFLTSVWGLITIIGLAVIITVASFILSKNTKKAVLKEEAIKQENIEKIDDSSSGNDTP